MKRARPLSNIALLPLVPSLLQLIPPITQMVVSLAELVVALLPLINLFTQFSLIGIRLVIPVIQAIATGAAGLDGVFAHLSQVFVNVIRVVVDFVNGVIQNFIILRSQGQGLIQSLIGAIIAAFQGLPPGVLAVIRRLISGVTGLFASFASTAASAAGKVASAIVKAIEGGLRGLSSAFTRPFSAAKSAISGVMSDILSTVEGFVSKIQGAVGRITAAIVAGWRGWNRAAASARMLAWVGPIH